MNKAVGINHVTIEVKDKTISKNFYCNILDFDYKLVNNKHLWIILGNSYVHVSQNENKADVQTFLHFAVLIDSFKEYIYSLENKGVQLFSLAENNMVIPVEVSNIESNCFLKDPDGNLVELVDSKSNFFLKGE